MNDPIKPTPESVSPDVAALRAEVRDETLSAAVSAIRSLTRTERVRDVDPARREAVADAVRAVERLRTGVAR